jgi:hypothetical protein
MQGIRVASATDVRIVVRDGEGFAARLPDSVWRAGPTARAVIADFVSFTMPNLVDQHRILLLISTLTIH